MDKADIRKIIEQKVKNIRKLSKAIEKGFDPEALHKFRVEVKRLRSLLRLVATAQGNKEIKLPKKFKGLYDIAGIIREAQLEQKRIFESGSGFPSYSRHLALQMQYRKSIWMRDCKKGNTGKPDNMIKGHKLNKMPTDVLLQFMKEHAEQIQVLSKGDAGDDDMHCIRKQVKDMLYNAKFAEENWKAAYKTIKDLPLKELDKLSDSLGEYNDTRVWLEHFEAYTPDNLLREEKANMRSLCRKERSALELKKKKLLQSVRKFSRDMAAV